MLCNSYRPRRSPAREDLVREGFSNENDNAASLWSAATPGARWRRCLGCHTRFARFWNSALYAADTRRLMRRAVLIGFMAAPAPWWPSPR